MMSKRFWCYAPFRLGFKLFLQILRNSVALGNISKLIVNILTLRVSTQVLNSVSVITNILTLRVSAQVLDSVSVITNILTLRVSKSSTLIDT